MVLKRFIFSGIILIFCTTTRAQISGIVFDRISRKPLTQVTLVNLNSLDKTSSNDKGEFAIQAKISDLLVFGRPGYQSDTVLLTSMKFLQRYLQLDRNTLNTVTISGKRELKEKYAQAFNQANPILFVPGRGLLFYPSGYFSKKGKQAREFVRLVKREEKEKIIAQRFNLNAISGILPIKQPELDAFYIKYKPDLKFIARVSDDDLKSYILACYNKFKMLPYEQRILPQLKVK